MAEAVPTLVGAAPPRLVVVEWVLRIAVAMEFVGHGAFGVLTKAAWVPYFGVVGLPEAWAWRLMPLVGALDITVGVLALVVPVRAVLLHMALWGLVTASLRPLAGEGVWELLERAYNHGVPLAFLLLAGVPTTPRAWFTRVDLRAAAAPSRAAVSVRTGGAPLARPDLAALALRGAIGVCLIGHGGVALFTHTRWTRHLEATGVEPASAATALSAGAWFELTLGVAILIAPLTPLLVIAGLWKIGTEALRIPAGEPIWEFIERGGAYAAPLVLILLRRPAWVDARMPGRQRAPSAA